LPWFVIVSLCVTYVTVGYMCLDCILLGSLHIRVFAGKNLHGPVWGEKEKKGLNVSDYILEFTFTA